MATEEAAGRGRAADLEELWPGEFGDAYVTRNHVPVAERAAFWARILRQYPSRRVLKIGPAPGENLKHMTHSIAPHDLLGR